MLDPALKLGKDDTGIIVLGRKGEAIQVIADYSSNQYGPNEVIEALRLAIEEHPDATDLLIESNAAEGWLKKVLMGAELPIHMIYVRAKVSKTARAEQAIIISETGKLHVAKHLADGEFGEELTLWSPGTSNFSPGRIDCLAHGVNALMMGKASTGRASKMSVASRRKKTPEQLATEVSEAAQDAVLDAVQSALAAATAQLDAGADSAPETAPGAPLQARRGNTRVVVAGRTRQEEARRQNRLPSGRGPVALQHLTTALPVTA